MKSAVEPDAETTRPVLRSVIVDDEELGRCVLQDLITDYCPHLRVIETAGSADAGREAITGSEPDVVFLDIKMPDEDGFELLRSLPEMNVMVVFVTAYDQYALRAIKASAVDYLLKPVKIRDLRQTEQRLLKQYAMRASERNGEDTYGRLVQTLIDGLNAREPERRIALKHARGFDLIAMSDIVRLEAERNYTVVHIASRRTVIVSKPLSEFESLLDMSMFVRVHKSHIINLAYTNGYICEDAGYALMQDGTRVEISRRRSQAFFQRVNRFSC